MDFFTIGLIIGTLINLLILVWFIISINAIVGNTNAIKFELRLHRETADKIANLLFLKNLGAKFENRTDGPGEMKYGWWLDGVYLGKNVGDAMGKAQNEERAAPLPREAESGVLNEVSKWFGDYHG